MVLFYVTLGILMILIILEKLIISFMLKKQRKQHLNIHLKI